ncbi:cation:proton antiporter [bacterium]|nr:cation:proton antiporter [bacterium]
MHGSGGLEELAAGLVVVLGSSVVVLFAAHKIRLSPIVALLLTGMLIGPSGLHLIDRESVELFAELGVVLLLFTIGLEVSLVRLRRNWRPFLFGGGGQVALTIGLVALVALALNVPSREAVFLGFLAALSSTAIVLKTYTDRHELQTSQGMVSASVLLFQDFCLAPMLFLVPVLAGTADTSLGAITGRVTLGLLLVGAGFLVARTLMPRVLEWIVGTRTRELFVLGALTICLAMSLLTARLGLSMALGAFLAGLLISESHYGHQVVAEILPLRDIFNSIFFISIGMLLDFGAVAEHPVLVVVAGLALLLGKGAIAAAVTASLGYAARVALVVGLSLAQVGEFSLVLATVGRDLGLLGGEFFQVFLGAAILTMLVTPLLIQVAPRVADHAPRIPMPATWQRRRSRMRPAEEEAATELTNHVIIVGYGVNGRNVCRVLSSTSIPFVVLELNGAAVHEGKHNGHPVHFGDAARREILSAHGVAKASMLVVGIADQAATRRIVRIARDMNHSLHILVRTRVVSEVDELRALGADEVIPEEFETSVTIFGRVLERYHVPRNVIRAQRRMIRDEAYGMLRAKNREERIAGTRVAEILEAALTETFLVTAGSPADGETLQSLDLRRRSHGASVIAVVREGKPTTNPSPEMRLCANDNLVLVGSHAALEAAADLLGGETGVDSGTGERTGS